MVASNTVHTVQEWAYLIAKLDDESDDALDLYTKIYDKISGHPVTNLVSLRLSKAEIELLENAGKLEEEEPETDD
jgi:hypothetical protein